MGNFLLNILSCCLTHDYVASWMIVLFHVWAFDVAVDVCCVLCHIFISQWSGDLSQWSGYMCNICPLSTSCHGSEVGLSFCSVWGASFKKKKFTHLQLNKILAKVDDWQFDMFALNEASDQHALSVLGFALIRRTEAFRDYQMDEKKLAR